MPLNMNVLSRHLANRKGSANRSLEEAMAGQIMADPKASKKALKDREKRSKKAIKAIVKLRGA